MTKVLPAPLVGVICLLLLTVNTLVCSAPCYLLILVKLLTPRRSRARDLVSHGIGWWAKSWSHINIMSTDLLLPIRWEVRGGAEVDPRGQYLVCANHQTWNDILALMKAFGRRAPFFKFFLKQELIWVPVLGGVWWGLDYPFMKRHTKEQIAKNPALKGQDIATTQRACEAFRNQPALILNFLEGTRFTPVKHARQKSPYQYLLRPKSGGFAFALGALGHQLDGLLDVTIVYPEGAKGIWDFLCGRVRHVIVEIRRLDLPAALASGSYESDPEFRARFHTWIAQVWSEKDQRIGELLADVRRGG